MGHISVSKIMSAPADRVYARAKDVERFPEVVPDLTEVKVVSRDGASVVSTWRSSVSIAGLINRALYWKEEDIWNDDDHSCVFTLIEGDMKKYDGKWTFEPLPDDPERTVVDLAIDFELGMSMLGQLVIKLIDKLMKENCQALLDGLEKLVKKPEK